MSSIFPMIHPWIRLIMWIIVKYLIYWQYLATTKWGFQNWESNWWKGVVTHWYPIGSRFLWLLGIRTKIKGEGYSYSKSYPDIWAYFFEVSCCLTSEIIPNWNKKQRYRAHQTQNLEEWWLASKVLVSKQMDGPIMVLWRLMLSFLMTAVCKFRSRS